MKKGLVFFDIDYVLFNTRHFKKSKLKDYENYQETLSALKNLSEFITLGIFSKGKYDWQTAKLKNTGIANFFDKQNVHIFSNKNTNIKKVLDNYKDSKIFLIDDKLRVLYLVRKKSDSVFGVWLKRGPYAENQKPIPDFKPDAEVENLSDAVKIIRSKL